MPVILDSNEIKVIDGDKSFTIETVKSNVIVNQDTVINQPVVPILQLETTVSSETIDETYKYMAFTHSGGSEDQTEYSVKFNIETECDILIVGGGGSGGIKVAGGGGAGGLIFLQNEKLNGTHIITVGKGGDAINVNDTGGLNGYSSSFSNIIAFGGGGGGAYQSQGKQAGSGGSGGGSFLPTYVGLDIDVNSLGNDGGVGKYNYGVAGGGMTTTWYWAAGGGGGAGSKGEDAGGGTGNDSNSLSYAGGGGNGLAELNGVDFKTHFNLPTDNSIGHYVSVENKVYFAGGGGGGNDVYNDIARAKIPLGGKGGGGNGINNNITNNSINALANSGGGGGSWGSGSGSSNQVSGKGGSGIVIIRYKVVDTTMEPQTLTHYTPERMYPPTRNLASASHLISGESYGNGVYEVSESDGTYDPTQTGFSAFNTSMSDRVHFNSRYTNGVYNGSDYIVPGYLGDWIKIKLPRPIKLTKYGFKQRTPTYNNRAPGKYKLYGSNDGTNWDVLVHKITTVSYTQQISVANDYFEENINVNNQYQYFGLVTNELKGNTESILNFDEWYIYGKEFISEDPEYKLLTFEYQESSYSVNFPEDTTCDILIVGGGGGGGGSMGGGGGGGSVIYATAIELNGTYNIKVGNGGSGGINQVDGTNGYNSSFWSSTQLESEGAIAIGGGRGGDYNISGSKQSGGSGGGVGGGSNNGQTTGVALAGNKTIPSTSILYSNYTYYANDGGDALYQDGTLNETTGGGGGGAGSKGSSFNGVSYGGSGTNSPYIGLGGDGIPIDISGTNVYYGAGGGGGSHKGSLTEFLGASGGLGGGGAGGSEYSNGTKTDGEDGSGYGAGGGGGSYQKNGGNGGSGIVIIRYKTQYQTTTHGAQWTYHSTNPNTHHYGNVGIGTVASATQKLLVNGDMNVTGNYKQNDNTIGNWYTNGKDVYRTFGNVGIGNTVPQYSLHVQGVIYTGQGGTTGDGTTTWTVTSDSRMKDNIFKASYKECYEIFKKIELYRYNFKPGYVNSNDRNQLGFIAQEVQQQLPRSVEPRSIRLTSGVYIHDILTLNVTQINYILYGTFKYLIAELDIIKKHLESQEEAGQTE
jgi:hypothetical protein